MTRDEAVEMKQRLAKGGIDALMNLEVLDLIDAYLALLDRQEGAGWI